MLDELYSSFFSELSRYAQRQTRDKELAEDLTQETFLKALQNADILEELTSCQRRAWLYRTLKNLIVDNYRHASLEDEYVRSLDVDSAIEESGYERSEYQDLLGLLDVQERVLFQMRYLQDYNANELAQMFHMPPGTVRAKLARARKKLKKALSEF